MNTATLPEKAVKVLEKCPHVSIASITETGYPRTCVVQVIKMEGINKIYISTGSQSRKTLDFARNPKASIGYYHQCDSVTLLGTVRIVEDKAFKDALWEAWKDMLIHHFPEGPTDPNYCVLEFTTEEGTFFIDQVFETLTI